MSNHVLLFHEIDQNSIPYVGGKGANLGEMTKAGFPVPQGFCITTSAYFAFIQTSERMDHFFRLLDQVSYENLDEIRVLGQQIRAHLKELPISESIQASILKAWGQLGTDKAYAVRSSATAEDLPGASFAGQQETYLNVKGKEQFLESVKCCWASLFTDRAIVYRSKNGFDHRSVLLSVVVQEMIFPEVSGIMFTADPINGNRNTVSVDASFGLGEALVSGIVSADLYQVHKGAIVQKKIATKKVAIYSSPAGGTVTEELPREKQDLQALGDADIIELAELGKQIERHYGSEQDIEWCWYDQQFYIVQSRPITSLYPVPKVSDEHLHLFFSFGHQQMMPAVLSPMARSIWRTMFPFGKSSVISESKYLLEAGGRLYIDLTSLLQIKQARKMVPLLLREVDELIGSAFREFVQRPDFIQNRVDPGVKKKVKKTLFPIAGNVLKNILIRNPVEAMPRAQKITQGYLQECQAYIRNASGAERIARIQESCGSFVLPLFTNVATLVAPGMIAMKRIQYLSKKWLGDDHSVSLLNKSLPGNVTSEMGLRIGDLADIVRQDPDIADYLKIATADCFYEGLREADKKGVFSKKFKHFMEEYGMRCPGEIDVQNVRWKDDPTLLVPSILNQLHGLRQGEHRARFNAGMIEAEETARDIIAKLRKTPGGFMKAKIMTRWIHIFRNVMGLREWPKYTMVQYLEIFRTAMLEEGHRLVDGGALKLPSDVFYLTLSELFNLVKGDEHVDAQKIVESRMRQVEQDQKRTPPRVITSEGEIITGKRSNVNAPEGALLGTPVSAGIVEGYAKVVLKADEANLSPGEILIAPFTDPGWTSLFNASKGLVMEVGGMMTHGAVIAREYGIPAVVGIDNATELVKDGDWIRVNGTEGYIEILKRNGE